VINGKVELDKDLITIEKRTRVENTREYIPNVIEPSFGIGRILYSLIEQNFWHREGDEARGVSNAEEKPNAHADIRQIISFPPAVAPTKVLLVPLSNHPDLQPPVKRVTYKLRSMGISNRVDDSGASIGKRYSRNDELGTPFGVTVDFDSIKTDPPTYTLRERDSTKQVRAKEDEICDAIKSLVDGKEIWDDVFRRLPEFTGQSED